MIPREILKEVRRIEISTRGLINEVFSGEYHSVFKGRGMNFAEVREYQYGDDIRSIDWNVTARMGEPFVKRYVEERQLTLMLMADVSASQNFGSMSRSKREAAAEFCALLGFSASRNDDKVGLILFHGDVEQYIPPRKGQKHALRVVREVLAHGADREETRPTSASRWSSWFTTRSLRSAREQTDIEHAVEFFLSVTKRRTVCFVVSDFLDEGFEKALMTANRKHDVVAVLITDPRELEVPDVGLLALRDAETGRTQVVDAGSSAFRAAVRRAAEERVAKLSRRLRGAGIDIIHIDASGSVVDPVVEFFKTRAKRARR